MRRGWPAVSAGAVGFGLGISGLPFYTAGVFLDPLMHAFGWKAAQVQSGLLVMLWSTMALSPLGGVIADRFGSKRTTCVSAALFGLAFMSLGLTRGSFPLYLLNWGLLALAGAGTLPVVWGRVVSLRFLQRRGLALGLVLAGTGVTGFLAPPLAAALIGAFGWRWAYVDLGALPLLVSAPILALVLDKDPIPAAPAPGAAAPLEGADFKTALASPRFWLIAICVGLAAAGAAGVIPNLVKIIVASGQPRASAVGLASLVGLFVVAGRAASGALMDRFWSPGVAALFLAAPAVGCALLMLDHTMTSAAVAAILIGLAAGAEFDVLAFLIAAYFGLRRYGPIYGAAASVFGFASGATPFLFAFSFDKTGAYDQALTAAAIGFALAGAGLLLLGAYPKSRQTAVTP
jgi:MFS family permease